MPHIQNKDRLHLALYARGGGPQTDHLEDTYHWALIIGPKHEHQKAQGIRLHAKNGLIPGGTTQWFFQEKAEISLTTTNMLLIRITIAKIENKQQTLDILRAVPVRPEIEGWTCKSWVQEAMASLDADENALGSRVMDWGKVSAKAVDYCGEKKAINRFRGEGDFDSKFPPTFSFLVRDKDGKEGKEVIP